MLVEASNLRVRYRGGTPGLGALVDLALDGVDLTLTAFDCEVHLQADRSVVIKFPLTVIVEHDQVGPVSHRYGRALKWATPELEAEFQREALLAIRELAENEAPWDDMRFKPVLC